jgi:phage shock protein PspC (stress-responsive transcriptional regulator)
MNEVKKVHLGRQQFTISVEAHKDLHNYLTAIEKQPGVQPEVAKEVELRMAELLTERGITSDKVVLQEDVDFLKQQLGEPRDFKDEDENHDAGKQEAEKGAKRDEEQQPKKLFRDTQNGLIAGVASGLAAYMGIDVILIRIAFIALSFASGAGVLLYILIWLLAPEAKTPSERLHMQGKAVTVDTLKEMVDRADIAGASERASRNFGRGLGKALETFFRVIAGIIGVGIVIAGTAMMLWTVTLSIYLLIHGGRIGNEVAFPVGGREVWFVVLAFVTAAIVGFFMLMLGTTMVSRKWRLRSWLTAVLVGIFFVAASVGTALGFDAVPQVRERFRAAHHSQTRNLQEFNKVRLIGEDTAFRFKPDTKYYVELSYLGTVNTTLLTTVVDNKVLTINSDDFTKTPLCTGFCFYSGHDLTVTVHAPALEDASLPGTEDLSPVGSPFPRQDMATWPPR